MNDYRKDTNYWCKFCSTYVRNTPLIKQQHESSIKHQNNIQRSLRTLHKTHERDVRDKERAQAEVRRLNAVVPGSASAPASSAAHVPAKTPERDDRPATLEQRKAQMAQLAALGVAVPEEFRPQMAQAGEWRTIATRKVEEARAGEDVEDEVKIEPGAESFGVRKRKGEDGDDAEEEVVHANGRESTAWGSRVKKIRTEEDLDIAALVGAGTRQGGDGDSAVKKEDGDEVKIKAEDGDEEKGKAGDDAEAAPAVVFKKRNKKRA